MNDEETVAPPAQGISHADIVAIEKCGAVFSPRIFALGTEAGLRLSFGDSTTPETVSINSSVLIPWSQVAFLRDVCASFLTNKGDDNGESE